MNLYQKVYLAQAHWDKPCLGVPCDEDVLCKRHNRTVALVLRLARREDKDDD
jgi:hypothetical protein